MAKEIRNEEVMEEAIEVTADVEEGTEVVVEEPSKVKKHLNRALTFGKKLIIPVVAFTTGYFVGKKAGVKVTDVAEVVTEVIDDVEVTNF